MKIFDFFLAFLINFSFFCYSQEAVMLPSVDTRGKRYVYMEAGHSAQNIYLEAETLNLATVVVGAFDDEKVKKVLKVKSVPLYIMPIGRRRDGAF